MSKGHMQMKTIREEARDVPVMAEADIVVLGGGSAGLAAAVAAGRSGADVLLVERYGYVGGLATGGLVITMPPTMEGPLNDEIDQRMQELKTRGLSTFGKGDAPWPAWCPEVLKWLGLRMLEEAGVKMLFHSWCAAVVKEDGVIDAVLVENKGGRGAVKGKVFIDGTGDADIAAFAGTPFEVGDENGRTLPSTMMFMLSNVDESKYRGGGNENAPHHLQHVLTHIYPGYANVWGGSIKDIDGTDPWDLTRAENEQRKQVYELWRWMRENLPGFENSFISLTAPQVGIRESRRVVGEYQLTRDDWKSGTVFDDHIGFGWHKFSIPYRSLVAKEVDNLLVAGRCMACDQAVQHSIRHVTDCIVTGFAAGVAAAQAAGQSAPLRDLDTGPLTAELKKLGVRFP